MAVHSSYKYRIQQPQLVSWEHAAGGSKALSASLRGAPAGAAPAGEGGGRTNSGGPFTILAQLLPRSHSGSGSAAVLGAVVATGSRLTVGGTTVQVQVSCVMSSCRSCLTLRLLLTLGGLGSGRGLGPDRGDACSAVGMSCMQTCCAVAARRGEWPWTCAARPLNCGTDIPVPSFVRVVKAPEHTCIKPCSFHPSISTLPNLCLPSLPPSQRMMPASATLHCRA